VSADAEKGLLLHSHAPIQERNGREKIIKWVCKESNVDLNAGLQILCRHAIRAVPKWIGDPRSM
jgi:hypothetical protein